MENKIFLTLFSTLILSYFITQSIASKRLIDSFMSFEKYKLMSKYTDRSPFSANKLDFDATKLLYSQEGLKEMDKITKMPGQPTVSFYQYSGYVTVNQKAGRALFYYFAEAQRSAKPLPLVLWLNGGPGCSSLGYGAMEELGPFRVMSDGDTLFLNKYAWNQVGVGFSYSNTTSDYMTSGDNRTATDCYIFLVNWLNRFPEYKNRDFYIAGESYAGHYVPQLASTILRQNSINKFTINLKGIIVGNAELNDYTDNIGQWEYLASHALITEELAKKGIKDCEVSSSDECHETSNKASEEIGDIDIYNIYAPICLNTYLIERKPKNTSIFNPDPCGDNYVNVYLNRADVQEALHANVNKIFYNANPWQHCRFVGIAVVNQNNQMY